jgi:riboflavin kinase/FMN adenylyltransferase
MQIYKGLSAFPKLEAPVLTLGSFDGVHVGHQKILSRLVDAAKAINGQVVLLTFDPHPRKILFPSSNSVQLLSTLDEKIDLLSKYGVEHLVVQPFTRDFSMMEHDFFIRELLVKQIGVKKLVIGYDHQFGHNRSGSFKELELLAPSFGFEVEEIPEQDINDSAVSSTRIRKALLEGNIVDASNLLGYDYSFTGTVVKGNQIGRTLGFPTANLLSHDPDKLVPANGVYAVIVEVHGSVFKGVLSIGNRPTFDNGARSVEVNIFEFNQDIYGEECTVRFKNFIRPELKFNGVDELVVAMKKDKEKTLELLGGF